MNWMLQYWQSNILLTAYLLGLIESLVVNFGPVESRASYIGRKINMLKWRSFLRPISEV